MHKTSFVDISYSLIRFFLGPIIRFIWVKKVIGLHHIPRKGPVIIAFNHQSYFDFICFIAISPRNIHYLSAEKFLSNPIWKFLLGITGQIPVVRKARDKRSVHNVVYENLAQGKMIGIFPEGTRAADNTTMLKAYSGVTRYALTQKVPIVPVGIRGAFEVLSRDEKFPKFKKIIEFHIGAPLHFKEYHSVKLNKRAFNVLVRHVMLDISSLSGKAYPHQHTHD